MAGESAVLDLLDDLVGRERGVDELLFTPQDDRWSTSDSDELLHTAFDPDAYFASLELSSSPTLVSTATASAAAASDAPRKRARIETRNLAKEEATPPAGASATANGAASTHARTSAFLKSLSEEERTMLEAEGVAVPEDGPLSKEQERELKRMRRKIKNKISAKDSRQRRKQYLNSLETVNNELQQQVQKLEAEKKSLAAQMKCLYDSLRPSAKTSNSRACVMMMFFLMFTKGTGHDSAPPDVSSGTLVPGPADPLPASGPDAAVLADVIPPKQASCFQRLLSQSGILPEELDLPNLGVEGVVIQPPRGMPMSASPTPSSSSSVADFVPDEVGYTIPPTRALGVPPSVPLQVASNRGLKRKDCDAQ